MLNEAIDNSPGLGVRLVVSVRFPTDLDAVLRLSDRLPGCVFIHTGFKEPQEPDGDRGQFHSKLVLIERDDDERIVLVGSHNWTENALAGHNLEAGMVVHCRERDPLVGQVRRHIEACIEQSEPFDAQRLRFYQTVQADLQPPKPTVPSEDFPGFEWLDALVIHAELDPGATELPEPIRLYLPLREPLLADYFTSQQLVWLFLYPPGTLIGRRPPATQPRLFTGRVVMNNAASDAPVIDRAVNGQLDDVRRPAIIVLPDENLPSPSGERAQIVLRLERAGPSLVPLFHYGQQAPKMALKVAYEDVSPTARSPADVEVDGPDLNGDEVVFQAPHHLVVQCRVKVPSPFLYPVDYAPRLRGLIVGDRGFHQSDEPRVEFDEPPAGKLLSPYIYLAHYRLDDATMTRIAQQGTLFT